MADVYNMKTRGVTGVVLFVCLLTSCTAAMSQSPDKPQLRFTETEDLHFECDLGGLLPLLKNSSRVLAMQIQFSPDSDEEEFMTLATVDPSSGARPSNYLNASRCMYKMSGQASPSPVQAESWWLSLVFVRETDSEFGSYRCSVTYTDSARDKSDEWTSEGIPYFPGSDKKVAKDGFRMKAEKGLEITCQYNIPDGKTVVGIDISAVPSPPVRILARARWSKNEPGFCYARALCRPRTRVGSFLSCTVHLLNYTYVTDDVPYLCRVRLEAQSAATHDTGNTDIVDSDRVPPGDRSGPTTPRGQIGSELNDLGNTTQPTKSGRSHGTDCSIPVVVAVAIAVLVFLVAVVVCCFCRSKIRELIMTSCKSNKDKQKDETSGQDETEEGARNNGSSAPDQSMRDRTENIPVDPDTRSLGGDSVAESLLNAVVVKDDIPQTSASCERLQNESTV